MATPIHQWTHDGDKVLIVRFCDHDGASRDGFRYPLTVGEVATAPDWDPAPKCGGGLHGWAWGIGIGAGKYPDWSALWQVYSCAPEDVVGIEGEKCKFRAGELLCSGKWWEALAHVRAGAVAWSIHTSSGAAAATGERGAAAATGESGSAAATGERSIAAISGEYSTVEAGKDGIAASTADECIWIARPGSVFIQSWDGWYVAISAREIGAVDGERIHWNKGKIVKREKP